MEVSVLFWKSILISGTIGIALVLFLLFRISRELKRYIPLIIYTILILIELLIQSAVHLAPKSFPHLLYVTEPFAMLYGALIFLYVRNYNSQSLELKRFDLLFLIPFVLAIISYIPYYAMSAEEKLTDLAKFGSVQTDVFENIWEWNFDIVLNSAFLIAALIEIRKYNYLIKEQLSDIHKVDLHITKLVIKVCLVSYLLEFLFVFLTLFGFPYYELLYNMLTLTNFIVMLTIAYDAMVSRRYVNDLLKGWSSNNTLKVEVDGQLVKYAKSTLNEASSITIKTKLLDYMEEHRPYLKPQLRIKELSELTGISSHHISQVINESFQQNFYEFVNAYRVKAAKRILKDPGYKNYTLTAIGFEVGFNSKSAFYSAFKKSTGSTPAKF